MRCLLLVIVVVVVVVVSPYGAVGRDCLGSDSDRGSGGNPNSRYLIHAPRGYSSWNATRQAIVRRMAGFYKNCSRILGSMVINQLEDGDDASFLADIEEVYGFVDIYNNTAATISLPSLRIIRGQQLVNGHALLISTNHLQYFDAPKLHSIEQGNIDIIQSPHMRCADRIGWVDIMHGRQNVSIANIDFQTNACVCDSSCVGQCFIPQNSNKCYKDTFIGCSAPGLGCGQRCNLDSRICCHAQCAGGCTAYGDTHCFSCVGKRVVLDNGQRRCVANCPPLTVFDPRTFQEVPNPDGRYNYRLDCVKSCQDVGQLTYKQDCVADCPQGTERNDQGVCMPCSPTCKQSKMSCLAKLHNASNNGTNPLMETVGECKACKGTNHNTVVFALDKPYLENNMTNCTLVQGDLRISAISFFGNSAAQHQPLNASDLAALNVLLSIEEITGCLWVDNSPLNDLSFLRNVRKLGKCQRPYSGNAPNFGLAAFGTRSQLRYLGLPALRSVGGSTYMSGSKLCYINTLATARWNDTTSRLLYVNPPNCTGHDCSSLCSDDGCLGPGAANCYECRHVAFRSTCFANCSAAVQAFSETRPVYLDAATKECRICNSLCFPNGCTGPSNRDCNSCPKLEAFGSCVDTCPEGTYVNTATKKCLLCNDVCRAPGMAVPVCTGPGAHYGPGGCSECTRGIVTGGSVNCVLQCPAATTYNSGKLTVGGIEECYHCHTECSGGCFGTKATECTTCKNYYRLGTNGVRDCIAACDQAIGYIVDKECRLCNTQCRGGCTGSTAADCKQCTVASRLLEDGRTECLEKCADRSYRVPQDDGGFLCVDTCGSNMYNNTDGVCIACNQQCNHSCTDGGSSLTSCANRCRFFVEEGRCVQDCSSQYIAKEGTQECMFDSPDEPGPSEEQTSKATNGIISGSVVGGVLFIVVVLVISAYLMKRANLKADLYANKQIELEIAGADNPTYATTSNMDILHASPAQADPNAAQLVLAQENEIIIGKELGEGAFGAVYEGTWIPADGNQKVKVAVKVLKENTGAASNKEILDESVVMASMSHPYLVRLLCISMAPRVMMITELMELGSLLSYLRNRKKTLTGDVLLLFGRQIAEGMAYLESKRMIHRDLAARNVLVAEHRCVKITDFGLARLLDVGAEEFQHDGGKMPVKWLAPECMQERIFTHQTDVWSFGVTMWEVLTFGNAPFKGCKATEIFSLLLHGNRLPKPSVASAELYDTILECWGWEPGMRPTFEDLVQRFATMEKNPPAFAFTKADKKGLKFLTEADFASTAPELVAIDDDGYERLNAVIRPNPNKRSSARMSGTSFEAEYDNSALEVGNSYPSRDTLPGTMAINTTVAGYDNINAALTNKRHSVIQGSVALCSSQTKLLDGDDEDTDDPDLAAASDPYLAPVDNPDNLSGQPSDPYLVPADENFQNRM